MGKAGLSALMQSGNSRAPRGCGQSREREGFPGGPSVGPSETLLASWSPGGFHCGPSGPSSEFVATEGREKMGKAQTEHRPLRLSLTAPEALSLTEHSLSACLELTVTEIHSRVKLGPWQRKTRHN